MPIALIIWLIHDLVYLLFLLIILSTFIGGGLLSLYLHDLLPLTRGFYRKQEIKEAKHQIQLTKMRNLENQEMNKLLMIERGNDG